MHIKRLIKNNKGDTIVEVLISIAIMSLVLTISYALSNRNSQYIQQSQERGEAQKISEEQLELLRSYLTPTTPWVAAYKCFDDATQQPTADANKCYKGVKDSGVGRYNVRIVPPNAANPNTYTVTASWDSLTSTSPKQTLELAYKLPVTALVPAPAPLCSDGADNDGDGKIDLADPGCSSAADNDEYNPPPPACSDGADNDGDGKIDLADPGCSSAADNDEYNPPPPQCRDGADNDSDNLIDDQDPGCHSDGDRFNPYTYDENFNDESRCSFAYKSLCL
jgi:Tfp pilus assembly protein PilV